MAKKTATSTTTKKSTAARKKGPVKKATTTKGKPAAKSAPAKRAPKKTATKSSGKTTAKKPSGLDAAAQVLEDAGEPLRCREIVDRMLDQKLWTTKGSTPHATIYAAIIREIANKGAESRFKKIDRGLFTLNDTK